MSETIERKGITFTVTVEMDEYADLSYLGEFTSRWQPGCIDHNGGPPEHDYFLPCNTAEEHRKRLAKRGYSKHEAFTLGNQYVQRDYQRMTSYNNGNWWMDCIVVTASVNGIELERDTQGGVESDCGDEHLQEIVEDMIGNLLAILKSHRSEMEEAV